MNWKRRLLILFERFFPCTRLKDCNNSIYLCRWKLLNLSWFGIYLHKFRRSDTDYALHDHPWSFISIILWQGYEEWTEAPHGYHIRRKWPGMILWRPDHWKHRVELVNEVPSWSLVMRFRRRREWGFWQGSKFTHWKLWPTMNCEDDKKKQ